MDEEPSRREKFLAALADMREKLQKVDDKVALKFLADLDVMEQRILAGEALTKEDWEQLDLQLVAWEGEVLHRLRRINAQFMLSLEERLKRNPHFFDEDEQVQEALRLWNDGGREQILGSLPIAERHELEEQARQWGETLPGNEPPSEQDQ